MLRRILAVGLVMLGGLPAVGQVVAPPPPASYDAEIRYRIRAQRTERIRSYMELVRALDAAGMQRRPDEPGAMTDPDAERMYGTLPPNGLPAVLANPAVRTVFLTPTGFDRAQAETAPTPVAVRISVVGGMSSDRQLALFEQTRFRLQQLGFVEKVGYDTRGFTRIFGTVPGTSLPALVRDIRWAPAGWLLPETNPDQLPEPLRSLDAIRVVEVVPDPEGSTVSADATTPIVEPALAKLSPDLRAYLTEEGNANKPTRMEVVMFDPIPAGNFSWRAALRTAGSVAVEGRAGSLLTIVAPAAMARELVLLSAVATVRLPVAATAGVPSGGTVNPADAVMETNLGALHGYQGLGQGIRLAIIDSDFAGVRRLLSRSLPPGSTLLDMTAERSPTIEPDPIPDDRLGRGTLAALAATRAAPRVQLVLIRVDPTAPHMILSVARAMAGEAYRTEAVQARYGDLLLENERLLRQREKVNDDRRQLMADFNSDEATSQKRAESLLALTKQDREERDYERKLARFVAFETAFMSLRYVNVVACNVNWNEGMPTDGSGPLALYLDGPARFQDRLHKLGPLTWLQAAGDTNGQCWAGSVWDHDNNGVFEFATRQFPIPAGKWTRELNFLGWQPHEGTWSAELPAGAKVRLALQWTEAQDTGAAVDPYRYRTPLTNMQPLVVRQRDPRGEKLASDDLEVVVRATSLPMLINRTAGAATFEHVIEFTVAAPGRYAVRLEGRPADTTAPPEVPSVPASRKRGEIYPRLFVSVVDEANRATGRPVFIDFRSVNGGAATPADAFAASVVGGLNAAGQPQVYSSRGSAPNLGLVHRPTFHAFDEFAFGPVTARGTAMANGFSAGTVAAMLSIGAPPSHDLKWLRLTPGATFHVPSGWLQQVGNRTRSSERLAYRYDSPDPASRPNR